MTALITTMIKLFFSMAIGYFLKKRNIINDTVSRSVSALIVNISAPCLMFSSIVTMDSSQFQNALTLLWVGVLVYVGLILLAVLVVKLLKIEEAARGVYKAALIFGNVSFLGIPLAQSLYGQEGVFYIALLNIHFMLLFFSYGIYMIMTSGGNKGSFSPKKLVNSGLISIIAATLLYFLRIPVPDMIVEPLSFVGSLTSPVSMIIVGSSIASYSLKKVFSMKKLYIMSVLKLLVFPIIAYFILKLTLGDNLLTKIVCIYIGMPTASIVGMTAMAYGTDVENTTSCITMMTVLSLVTIPIIYIVMLYL
ncbi:MAG: AEC family transporter [Parasporobacterium sp.]|nr:AEC family transporter [Parasporobacterium sp.]